MKARLIGKDVVELGHLVKELGMPRYKAGQIARWVYTARVDTIDAMTDLSLDERRRLSEVAEVGLVKPILSSRSSDGTVKYLFPGVGGRNIEAVAIPDGDRMTLCVSSQAGCRMGCRFCATGRGGFQGQLTAADIVNQVLSVPESKDISNIVFMGMGEPLDNIEEVLHAIRILTSGHGLAMSPRRITVSTVGAHPEALERLLKETQVHVALSLHIPYPSYRRELMPAEKVWPVSRIIDMLRNFDWRGQRRLSIEYIVWGDFNDRPRDAAALTRLLHKLPCRINLIPYHPIGEESEAADARFKVSERMEEFQKQLQDAGFTTTIRASRGRDIAAACGQLAGKAATTTLNHYKPKM